MIMRNDKGTSIFIEVFKHSLCIHDSIEEIKQVYYFSCQIVFF